MMKQTRLITSVITLLAMLCLLPASVYGGNGKWLSVTTGSEIAYITHDTPKQPALDYS